MAQKAWRRTRVVWAQASRFLSVGAVATLIHYAILLMLSEWMGVDPVWASAIGFIVSALFNYVLNYYFTFSSKEPHVYASMRFACVAGVGLMLNTLFMYLLHKQIGIHYVVAQLFATGGVLVWNFFANRHWTYKAAT